jgi:hypothetical protein
MAGTSILDKFFVRKRGEKLTGQPRSMLVLTTDIWDDYNYKVQFHLSYIGKDGAELRIGPLKVLCRKQSDSKSVEISPTTVLPGTFEELNENFISLGQEDDYYIVLRKKFSKEAEEILTALRDIAWQPALAMPFEPTTAFRNALMRENGAHRARRFGRAWALGQPVYENLAFTYSGQIEGAEDAVEVQFAFDGKDRLPGRVVGIIGRNAVGKTRFLANLGENLVQQSVLLSASNAFQMGGHYLPERSPFPTAHLIDLSAQHPVRLAAMCIAVFETKKEVFRALPL